MIKIGIVGTGLIARTHAKAIAEIPHGARLVAAADVSPQALAAFAAAYPGIRQHADVAALIADPQVDVVAITTPPSAHEAVAIAALEAGKYVLCEKPLAHSLASAQRIAEAAARHPGKLSVSHQLRYEPIFRRMTWLARNGWVGELQSALIERHSFIPHTTYGAGGWWGAWEVSGGGVLMTQVIHELDHLIEVMGRPVSVTAEMDTRFTPIQSEDVVDAQITFESGATARCFASVNSGHHAGKFDIRGAGGVISLPGEIRTTQPERRKAALRALDAALPDTRAPSQSLTLKVLRKLLRRPAPVAVSPHARLYLAIDEAVRTGAPLPIPAEAAMGSLELCMAIYQAAITGQRVDLPLAQGAAVYEGVSQAAYDGRKCRRAPRRAAAY